MKFRAKPIKVKMNEFEKLLGEVDVKLENSYSDYLDEDGYITGWYVDGAIVGKFIEFNEEYIVNEFWCKIDVSTLEVVE